MSLRANGSYLGPRPAGPSTIVASGIWDLRTAERQRLAAAWPIASLDAYFASVLLLLRFDGLNGSTSFADYSSYARTGITSSGGAVSTAQSKFGGASLEFGSGTGISVPYAPSLDFGSEDFVIEFWLRLTTKVDNAVILQGSSSPRNWFVYSQINGSGDNALSFLAYNESGGVSILPILGLNTNYAYYTSHSTATYNTAQWYHVAVSRSGNTLRSYVDGVLRASAPISGAIRVASQSLDLGYGGGGTMSGYFDELRITKGTDRGYTGATIVVPTTAYPAA